MLIAFDMDGTLCDPLLGIARSINAALEQLDVAVIHESQLRQYIGPPLEQVFKELLPDEAKVQTAMAAFRARYKEIGFKECTLYDGIEDMLSNLVSQGHQLCLVTSKAQQVAEQVLAHFSLADYFEGVWGSENDRSKSDSLALAANTTTADVIMVGDRKYDIEAAIACDFTHIGVLWGFGNEEELLAAGATKLVRQPSELIQMLHPR